MTEFGNPSYNGAESGGVIQAAPLVARRADQVLSVPQVMTQAAGQVYAKELTPTDMLQNAVQGPTPLLVGLSSFGACPTPTGELFSVGPPVMTSQLFDSYGLPVPGGPPSVGSFRVTRSTGTSKRYITNTHPSKITRLPYVSSNQAGHAIGITPYGKFAYIDANGVTHQPPGTRDPVVNRDKFDVLYDGKTIKLDASTNQLYADILGLDAPGSASDTIPAGPLTAGHAITIIPGPGPSDPPAVTMLAGAGIDQPATFQWSYSITRYGKETGLSPAQSGVTDGTYGQASIDLPDLPSGDVGTAYTLYRKDVATGADGSIQTKFAYTTTTGAVLITDASTGAVEITSGPETGLWVYTVLAANGNIHKGDEYLFNPSAYVVVGDPPVPIDPRTGAQLHIDVAPDGSYIFTAADTGIFNAVTGAVTFPPGSPRNATVLKTVVAGLSPVAQTYVDSTPNTGLGAVYARGKQTVNVKKAAYILAPFSGMSPIPGTVPPQYEYNGLEFSSDDPLISNDGLSAKVKYGLGIDGENNIDVLLAASGVLPATGTGDQTARALAGYEGTVYNVSALTVTAGDSGTGLAVKYNPSTLEEDANGALNVIGGGGGGGGGGTGSPVVLRLDGVSHGAFANHTEVNLAWSSVGLDHGGWVTAGTQATGPDIIIPVTGTYGLMIVQEVDLSSTPASGSFCHIDILRNGISIAGDDFEAELTLLEFPTLVWNSTFDFTAGDVIHIGLSNRTGVTISADLGTTSLWLIQSQPSTVAFSCYDLPSLVGGALAPSGTAFVRWDSGIEIDEGGWVAAGTDAAGSNMVIPVAGTYDVNLQLKLTHPIAGSAEVVQIYVFINGAGVYTFEYDVSNLTNSIIEFHKNIVFALHDAVKFRVNNYTVHNLVLAQGHIDLHKV